MPNKDENSYVNKADLESVIQKVRIENESQEVHIANADDVTKPLLEEEKKNQLRNLEEKIERKKQGNALLDAIKTMTKTLFRGLMGFAKGVLSAPKKLFKLIAGAFLTFASIIYYIDEILFPIRAALEELRKVGNFLSKRKTKFLSSLGKRIGSFFEWLRQFGRNIKAWGLKKLSGVLGKASRFFTKIRKFFRKLVKMARSFNKFTKFLPILRTVLGSVGKLFLPITILLGIIDFVKGFMRGYKEGGIIGGITEGIVELFDGMIGTLLRLLGWIPKKLFELLGLDNLSAAVMPAIESILDSIKNTFKGLVDVVVGIFTLDGTKIIGGLTKIWDSILSFLTIPFTLLGAFFKDLFDVDPFTAVKETFMLVIDTVMGVFEKLKNGIFNFVRNKVPGGAALLDFFSPREDFSGRRKVIKKTPPSMGKDYSMAKPGGNRGRGSRNSNNQTNNNVSNTISYNIQGNTTLASDALNFATT